MNAHTDMKNLVEECVGHPVIMVSGSGSLLQLPDDVQVWKIVPEDPFNVHEFISWHLACNRQWFESQQQAADQYCHRYREWEETLTHNSRVTDYTADSIEFRL